MVDISYNLEKFREFFDQEYRLEILKLEKQTVGEPFLEVDFLKLSKFDSDLASYLLEEPKELIPIAGLAATRNEHGKTVEVLFHNLPQQAIVPLNKAADQLEKFLTFEGYVMKPSDLYLKCKAYKAECRACGNVIIKVLLGREWEQIKKCGCGNKLNFRILSKEMTKFQIISLMEAIDVIPEKPRKPIIKKVFLEANLTRDNLNAQLQPGQRVKVHGFLELEQMKIGRTLSNEFKTNIVANNIVPVKNSWEGIELTKNILKNNKKMAKKSNLLGEFAQSIAPTFEGYEVVRESLILMHVEGKRLYDKNGNLDERGSMSVLLAGNPGCLPIGTLIQTPNGLTPIEEVTEIFTINSRGNKIITSAIPLNSGKKQKYKITTKKEELFCSGNHKWFVRDERGETLVVQTKDLNTSYSLIKEYDRTNLPLWKQILLLPLSKSKILFSSMFCKIQGSKNGAQPCIYPFRQDKNNLPVQTAKTFSNENSKDNGCEPSRDSQKIKSMGYRNSTIQRTGKTRDMSEYPQIFSTRQKKSCLQAWKIYWENENKGRVFKNSQTKFSMGLHEMREDRNNQTFRFGSASQRQRPFKQFKRKYDDFMSKLSCKRTRVRNQLKDKKILGITKTEEKIGMYDLIVPDYHNFILSNGIISHNSGKTFLARRGVTLSPHWVWTTGKGLTAAGLVACVVKDEFEGFTLEIGPLIMADMGSVFIDEIEKMDKEYYGALNNIMAEEETKITKGTIDQTLRSKVAMVCTSNPIHRIFHDNDSIYNQLAPIPKDILDRFDVIWAMREDIDPDKINEKSMDRHIEGSHNVDPIWSKEDMQPYIAQARRINPILNKEMARYFSLCLTKLTGSTKEDSGSQRLRGNILRWTYAHAKFTSVGKEDKSGNVKVNESNIDFAFNLIKHSFKLLDMISEEGFVQHEIFQDIPKPQEVNTYYAVKNAILDLGKEFNNSVPEDEIIKKVQESIKEFDMDALDKEIKKLKKAGDIFEPNRNKWGVM